MRLAADPIARRRLIEAQELQPPSVRSLSVRFRPSPFFEVRFGVHTAVRHGAKRVFRSVGTRLAGRFPKAASGLQRAGADASRLANGAAREADRAKDVIEKVIGG